MTSGLLFGGAWGTCSWRWGSAGRLILETVLSYHFKLEKTLSLFKELAKGTNED